MKSARGTAGRAAKATFGPNKPFQTMGAEEDKFAERCAGECSNSVRHVNVNGCWYACLLCRKKAREERRKRLDEEARNAMNEVKQRRLHRRP